MASSFSGALVLDKPLELSSSQVVSRLKWNLVQKGLAPKSFKIGHGGTLDPFATGVLLVLIGEGTKLADTYLHSQKAYRAVARLGSATDSGDLTGTPIAEAPLPSHSKDDWQSLAETFVLGPYLQIPPMHSAKKRDGIALYELARQGLSIEREGILKTIHHFQIEAVGLDQITFEVTCESGTYVRVLAEDLAKKAGTLAHLIELRRTRSSDRTLQESLPLEETLQHIQKAQSLEDLPNWIPLAELASHIPTLEISEAQAHLLRQGNSRAVDQLLAQSDSLLKPSRYALARMESNAPVALLERIPGAPSRLQRIFTGEA